MTWAEFKALVDEQVKNNEEVGCGLRLGKSINDFGGGSFDDDSVRIVSPPVTDVKAKLLKKHAEPRRLPHGFVQLDGFHFADGIGDDVFRPDQDHDSLMAGRTVELRASNAELAVRVLIHDGTDPAIAVRLLRKLSDWYERSPDIGSGGRRTALSEARPGRG